MWTFLAKAQKKSKTSNKVQFAMKNIFQKLFIAFCILFSHQSAGQIITPKLLIYGCSYPNKDTLVTFCFKDSMQTNILLTGWYACPRPKLKLTQIGDTLKLNIQDTATEICWSYCTEQFKVRYYGNLMKDYYLYVNNLPMYVIGCSTTSIPKVNADLWRDLYEIKDGVIKINSGIETDTRISNLLGDILISTKEKEIEISEILNKQTVLILQVSNSKGSTTRKIIKSNN